MTDLNYALSETKKKYREIFVKSIDAIQQRIDELKPTDFSGEIFDKYEKSSTGEQWQNAVLKMLENDISHEIYRKWNEIIEYRNKFECKGCATCCNLACSEYSPEELTKRAQNGDNFAKQFTSIFIPYPSQEDAEKIYPEYIKLLKDNKEEKVYFYHCPKLNECKLCSDYENRPEICRVFPDNPMDILPENCGFFEWKKEVEPVAMMLHAMVEIIGYYKVKIEENL